MLANAIVASAIILLFFYRLPPEWIAVFPEFLSLGVLLAGFCWGPRAVAVLLPCCWAVLSSAWVIEDRLDEALQGKDLVVTGVVCDMPRVADGVQQFLLVTDAAGQASGLPARSRVSWYATGTLVRAGERWRLKVRLRRPRGARNPAGFDFERWAFARDIGATGYVRRSLQNQRLEEQGGGCALTAYRQRFAASLAAAVPDGGARGHLLALSVGFRHELEARDWTVLRRTGTAHLMAISGLHIGLAAGCAFFVCRWLGHVLLIAGIRCRPLTLARTGALAGAAGYSALAGFSVPTVRAMVMTGVVLGLTGLRRSMPMPAVLGTALYAVLWVSPQAMLSPGFWLSFGAVFVLLLSGFGEISGVRIRCEPQSRGRRIGGQARRLWRAQVCLMAGMMPATAFFFGEISAIAPLANLLAVPVFALLLVPLLLTGIVTLLVLPVLAAPLLETADAILVILIGFLATLSRWSPAAFDVPELTALSAGAGALVAAVLIWPRPLPGRFPAILLLLVLAAVAGMRPAVPALRVVVIDVGQGLAVLLQTPGYAVLYDTGPSYRGGDTAQRTVLPVLRHFGVTRLEHLVVSHGDDDHAGGVGSILSAYPDTVMKASARLGVPGERFRPCRAGQQWLRDGVRFRFLHPDPAGEPDPREENDASCVLLVQSAAASVLLTGDIERRAERRLVGGGALPVVDLVIAPHHGSRTSSSPPFVAATRPVFVAFSARDRNRWGFPAADVVDRWQAAGACTLSTGQTGALVFETDRAGSLRLVKRYRLDEARPWNETDYAGLTAPRCGPADSVN